MISFTCPSCAAKCSVDDRFAGRKLKCPKCRTRLRHHADGTFELLSVGQSPSPASPGAPPGPVPSAPAGESAKAGGSGKDTTTVAIAVTDEKPAAAPPGLVTQFMSQSESRQNIYIAWSVVGVLVAVLSGYGFFSGDALLAVAPIAAALGAAFIWLAVRVKRRKARANRAEKERSLKEDKASVKEAPTEPLPKV